jgi:hypothetical protein
MTLNTIGSANCTLAARPTRTVSPGRGSAGLVIPAYLVEIAAN